MFGEQLGPEDTFLERTATEIGNDMVCTARCIIIGDAQGRISEQALKQAAKRTARMGVSKVLKSGHHILKKINAIMGPPSAVQCALDCIEKTSCPSPQKMNGLKG